MEFPFGLNPDTSDPGRWGASLLNNGELLLALLDAAGARSVMEVGAYAGDLTQLLMLWAQDHEARVIAIDPSPQPALVTLAQERSDLELVRETSLQALPRIKPADAVVLDGDHNYYTVTEELRAIGGWSDGVWPLVLLHDVSWPHARRDDYFDPEQIPAEFRHPTHEGGCLYPGVTGISDDGGLLYRFPAAREGGPRNGVLSAVEDYVAQRPELRLAVLAPFFGLGVVWHRDAEYADAIAGLVAPWDRHPLLTRLEANRALHLASSNMQFARASEAQERLHRIEPLLEAMLRSRAFLAAARFVRWRSKGAPPFSVEAVREALHR